MEVGMLLMMKNISLVLWMYVSCLQLPEKSFLLSHTAHAHLCPVHAISTRTSSICVVELLGDTYLGFNPSVANGNHWAIVTGGSETRQSKRFIRMVTHCPIHTRVKARGYKPATSHFFFPSFSFEITHIHPHPNTQTPILEITLPDQITPTHTHS